MIVDLTVAISMAQELRDQAETQREAQAYKQVQAMLTRAHKGQPVKQFKGSLGNQSFHIENGVPMR